MLTELEFEVNKCIQTLGTSFPVAACSSYCGMLTPVLRISAFPYLPYRLSVKLCIKGSHYIWRYDVQLKALDRISLSDFH
jgi:hypothetical protein